MGNEGRIHVQVRTSLIGSAVLAAMILSSPARGADIPYSGEVLKVDAAQHQVIVKNPQSGGRFKFVVTDGTAIISGGNKLTLGDIRAGEAVEIEYAQEGGRYVAHKIVIKSPGGK